MSMNRHGSESISCLADKVLARARSFVTGHEGRRGLAAIEFALFGPLIAMMFVCTADLGFALYHTLQVEAAAEAGAQYAAVNGFNATGISNAVAASTASITINASPAPTESCGCPAATGVTAAVCGSTCPDGNTAGTYVTETASNTYTTIIPYPTLPATFPLSSTAMVRIQ